MKKEKVGTEELGWLWEGGGVGVCFRLFGGGNGGVAGGRKGVCFLCEFRRIFIRVMSIIVPMQWNCIGCRWLTVNVRRAMLMRAGCGMWDRGISWGGFLLRAWRFCILYRLCVILDAVWVDDASPPSAQ